jgi:hypothetical protein
MSAKTRETAPPRPLPQPQTHDAGTLRLGGLSPIFAPAEVADPGLLRLGGLSPLFGRN